MKMRKKSKQCPFVRKKCLKAKCRCWNSTLNCCDFFSSIQSLYKIDDMQEKLND